MSPPTVEALTPLSLPERSITMSPPVVFAFTFPFLTFILISPPVVVLFTSPSIPSRRISPPVVYAFTLP